MEGKRLIQEIALQNFLSFGEEQRLALEPLNVLIGPNGSGKSNVLEAFALLQAAPVNLAAPIRDGGGVSEWLWKGGKDPRPASVEAVAPYEFSRQLRHSLSFRTEAQRFVLEDETVYSPSPPSLGGEDHFSYCYQGGESATIAYPTLFMEEGGERLPVPQVRRLEGLKADQSVLSQRKDPEGYPEFAYLSQIYSGIALYRDLDLSPRGPLKNPQQVDLPGDSLLEGGSNLTLVLNDLEHRGMGQVLLELQRFCPTAERITQSIVGGTVQVYVHERGLREPISARHLSDGMLRYLCLLAILCHPEPPPLICIDEPELGMHPDAIHRIGELLVEASQRTQLIVTTHSDALVSALSGTPESVVVCERDESGTQLRRLEPDRLTKWLAEYSLGDLWMQGEIGGTRW